MRHVNQHNCCDGGLGCQPPTTEQQSTQAALALRIIGIYTVAFSDSELKHKKDTVFDDKNASSAGVTVDRYGSLS